MEKKMRPETPALTVDAVIRHTDGGVILIERGYDPFRGQWALPGGFVEIGETVEQACIREVMEETGLEVKITRLLGVYSNPDRDPRGHTVSVVFMCETISGEPSGADDAKQAVSFSDLENIQLAFDHEVILRDAGIISIKK